MRLGRWSLILTRFPHARGNLLYYYLSRYFMVAAACAVCSIDWHDVIFVIPIMQYREVYLPAYRCKVRM